MLQVGLYSVPGEDLAKTLLSNLSTIAGLTGGGAAVAVQVTNLVKASVENIAGLDSTSLQLGVEDTFFKNNELREGYYIGINAPAAEINVNHLWLKDNNLKTGAVPSIADFYMDHDYMVIEIEKLDHRKDWPGFPELAEFNSKFSGILADAQMTPDQKQDRIRDLWPQFTATLNDSQSLVKSDREQIALSVSTDLKERLEALKTNPFDRPAERRGFIDVESKQSFAAADFDLINVSDRLDYSDRNSVREANQALAGSPF